MKKTIKTLLAEAGKLARLKEARAAWAVETGTCAATQQLSLMTLLLIYFVSIRMG